MVEQEVHQLVVQEVQLDGVVQRNAAAWLEQQEKLASKSVSKWVEVGVDRDGGGRLVHHGAQVDPCADGWDCGEVMVRVMVSENVSGDDNLELDLEQPLLVDPANDPKLPILHEKIRCFYEM